MCRFNIYYSATFLVPLGFLLIRKKLKENQRKVYDVFVTHLGIEKMNKIKSRDDKCKSHFIEIESIKALYMIFISV